MSELERRWDFTWMLRSLIDFAYAKGYKIVLGEVKRAVEMQKLYVEQKKSKTMQSKHLRSLAVDIALFKDGKWLRDPNDYKILGEYWESMGGRWGGRFGDNPATPTIEGWDSGHFEYNA